MNLFCLFVHWVQASIIYLFTFIDSVRLSVVFQVFISSVMCNRVIPVSRMVHISWIFSAAPTVTSETLCWSVTGRSWMKMRRRLSLTCVSHVTSHHCMDIFRWTSQSDVKMICFSSDMCKNCDHVIARHEYTFTVVDDYQVSRALST